MMTIRVGNADQDTSMLTQHNCAMALETENKILDPIAAQLGVYGLYDRPQFGINLVAEDDREKAASLMVTYEWSDWRNGLFWWIQSVYVKEDYRRKGIYRAMYAELKRMSQSQPTPVCGFRLYAETDNTNAHKTYRECGMHVCEYLMFEESNTQAG